MVPKPSDAILLGALPCCAIYETSDRKYVTVGALEPKFWKNLCSALRRIDYVPHQFNSDRREGIFRGMRAVFKTKSRKEWLEVFGPHEVPVAPANTLPEALADPHVKSHLLVRPLASAAGGVMQVTFPANFPCLREGSDQPPPKHGQHTREILRSLGYTEKQIRELKRDRVIGV